MQGEVEVFLVISSCTCWDIGSQVLMTPIGLFSTVVILVAPLLSDHLSPATSFPKYQTFPSQITIFGTSCKGPHVSNCDHFKS